MDKLHNLQPSAGNYSQPENPRFGADRAETGTVAAPADVVAMTIEQAAAELGQPPSSLRFWIDNKGCPVHRRGGRGRGNATLVSLGAVRRWMADRDQPTPPTSEHDLAMAYAQRLPDLLAQALYRAWCEVESPAKRQLAAAVAVAWYETACQELDRLRGRHPDIPHVTSLPEAINKLKSIV